MTAPQTTTASGPRRRRIARELFPIVLMLLLLGAARSSLANHYHVPTGSMEPTLMPGDRVLVDMTAYGLRIPFTRYELLPRGRTVPGDVAVFDSPADGTRLIKRVVAVGGDRVRLVDGRLWINGEPLQRPDDGDVERFGARQARLGLEFGGGPDIPGLEVPPGHVLVLGDARGNSVDSRWFGLVPEHALYARATRVYYRRGEGFAWKPL